MGGKPDSVGVVREPESQSAVAVDRSAPAGRRRIAGFPWESEKRFDVPFSARTYTFSWVDGAFAVLPEDWTINRDVKNRVTDIEHSPVSDGNKAGFPEVDFKTAKAIQDMSAKEGVSLKVAFGRIYDLSTLAPAVLEKIALAPDRYARTSQEAVVEKQRDQIKAEFFKAIGRDVTK